MTVTKAEHQDTLTRTLGYCASPHIRNTTCIAGPGYEAFGTCKGVAIR
jgi:hypothetical protein